MRVEVGLEHSGRHKGAAAEVTPVRLLSGVGAHVLLQVAGLFEGFTTVIASEIHRGKKKGSKYCSCGSVGAKLQSASLTPPKAKMMPLLVQSPARANVI